MKLLIIFCSLLTLQAAAQNNTNPFAVSPAHPAPGSTISITYKDKGTVLEGKKNIKGVVYSFANFKWQAEDLPLVWKDTAWTGAYQLQRGGALISCVFQADSLTDNGGRMTYAWLLSDTDNKQMPGAFYAWGTLRNPAFARKNPYPVNTTAYITDEITRMWFRYEVRDHPSSRPFIFKDALTLYKKTSTGSSTDQNIRQEIKAILSLPNLTEQAYMDAQQLYENILHDKPAADSLQAVILQQFPKGITARDKVINALSREADLDKKIKGIEQLLNDFPPAQFRDVSTFTTDLYYSKLFRVLVYTPIMKDSNYTNFFKYLPVVPTNELSTFYHHLVEIPHDQKKMALTTVLRLSDSIYRQIISRPADGIYSPSQWKAYFYKANAISFYTHAQILFESNQPAKALEVANLVNNNYRYKKADFNDLYVHLLIANKKKQSVMPYLLASAKENALSPYLLDLLKKDYLTKNKSSKGFETWIDSLKSKDQIAAAQKHLQEDLINLPIAPFRLESAKGGMADLTQLKGKIVVLDFWATWCGPCKAAMPGMQLAVNKYRADSNVAFYFIATMETTPDYKEQINKFITEKKYPFEVLYDGYNKESKHLDEVYGRYAKDYKLSGIPMKMIIDQQGRLRWLNTGYMGSPSALSDEISFIIETLKKENTTQQQAQASSTTVPYSSENVYFFNADSSIRFAGTLTRPIDGESRKAIVLVSGTGKQDRDGTMAGHEMFAAIADQLSRNGVAVLRVDDRGTGETTGQYEDATTEDFANDALLAVAYLKTRKDMKKATIGLLGHSEGGAAIAIAAAKCSDVKFLISLSGLASKGIDALLEQNKQLVETANIPQLDKNRYNDVNQLVFNTVYKYATSPELEKRLRDTFALWKAKDDKLVDSLQIKYDHFRFPLESYVRQATGKWYRYHILFDPAPYLSRIKVPVLALYGDKDLMLNAPINLSHWEKYTAVAHNSQVKTNILPGLNHLLQHCNTCTTNEYSQLKETMAPIVLEEITSWLKAI